MKKIILLTLLALMTICSAEDLRVETLEVKKINYENGNIGPTVFRIVCINGYKWLQYDGTHGSISQMFEYDNNLQRTMPIRCKN